MCSQRLLRRFPTRPGVAACPFAEQFTDAQHCRRSENDEHIFVDIDFSDFELRNQVVQRLNERLTRSSVDLRAALEQYTHNGEALRALRAESALLCLPTPARRRAP